MQTYLKFISYLFLAISIAGCKPQDKGKENTEDTKKNTVSMPKNFENVMPPAMMTDPHDRAAFLVTHFWDKFDFRDTTYCYVPKNSKAPSVAEQAFVNFLSIFPHTTKEKFFAGVKKMLDSAEVDVVMYNYFLIKAEHYLYDPNSQIRNDEFYIPFLEHVVSSSKIPEANKVRPKYQLALTYKNRIGEKASNFTYTLNSGNTGTLYGISSQYTLLMFYNPDCRECKQTQAEIKNSAAISAAVSAGKLKVLAVYPDENIEIWKMHTNDIPTSWINGYDKSQSVKTQEIYDLKAIPTLYLLDKDKKVILKDTSVGDIHEYLEK